MYDSINHTSLLRTLHPFNDILTTVHHRRIRSDSVYFWWVGSQIPRAPVLAQGRTCGGGGTCLLSARTSSLFWRFAPTCLAAKPSGMKTSLRIALSPSHITFTLNSGHVASCDNHDWFNSFIRPLRLFLADEVFLKCSAFKHNRCVFVCASSVVEPNRCIRSASMALGIDSTSL